MKTLSLAVLLSVSFCAMPKGAHGQIFVTTNASNTVGEYSLDGTAVNALLITALNNPIGVAVSGTSLFVTNNGSGTISEHTTAGAIVNASLVSGLSGLGAIALSGSNLFVAVGSGTNAAIAEYTTSGIAVNATLITGLQSPYGIAVSGSVLFVTNFVDGIIGAYTTLGATVNASLVTGLNGPKGLVVVPEPSAWALLVAGSTILLTLRFGRGKWLRRERSSRCVNT